ncbi:DUF6221 family protein [Micromonospora sp. NPDC023633]|uniref:DUF6221 family protein n=1 Tax=Micromonospora sp. NPDC023633 TaxID=3154320 RepID=UPI0033C5A5E7
MSSADALVTWLREQITAAETSTRTLLLWAQQTILTLQDPKLLGKHIPGWHDWPDVEKMCQQRLTELDAKRRILDEFTSAQHWADTLRAEGKHVQAEPYARQAGTWLSAARLLALPFAGQPGYRDEWRP